MPILGIYASSMQPALNASSYDSIATVTVGAGGSSSISFTSIPSTYKHLQIRFIARDNRASVNANNILTTFNSDTANNYADHLLESDGTTGGAYASTSRANIHWIVATSAATSASIFNVGVIDILDYTSTNKNKTVRVLEGYDSNGGGVVDLMSGLWFKTPEAITSITFTPAGSASFVQYTTFALYGIKA
jgi:hypothetical protein